MRRGMDNPARICSTAASSAPAKPELAAAGPPKLVYIDWLRGVAILLVIGVHHSQNFLTFVPVYAVMEFGQMGVQLFFVASALTLCMSAEGRSGEENALASFYLRRLFRIAPLYWVGIAVYTVAGLLAFPRGSQLLPENYTALNVVANILFIHGFIPSAQNTIVPGGWSIATEMAFYAMFPLLLAIYRTGIRIGFLPTVLGLPLLALAGDIVAMALIERMSGHALGNNSFLFYSILNQLPVFMIGMSGHFLLHRGVIGGRRAMPAAVLAAGIGYCYWCFGHGGPFALALLPAVAGTGFFGLVILARIWRRSRGIIERIGELSYSMYVFHFVFAWWAMGYVMAYTRMIPDAVLYPVTLGATIGAAYLAGKVSKRWIEDPFIALGRRVIRSLKRRRAVTV